MSDLRGAHIFVSGKVQGVGYRAFTERAARGLGLSGYSRNLPDGRVEVKVEGEREKIDRLVERLRQGPSAGRVDHLDVIPLPYSGEYSGFGVRL
ncbi:MAG TPA: acylphosphatase [Nitrospiria bacterium]|nr:acylphosphatase [Nitrospiria bacterium]